MFINGNSLKIYIIMVQYSEEKKDSSDISSFGPKWIPELENCSVNYSLHDFARFF